MEEAVVCLIGALAIAIVLLMFVERELDQRPAPPDYTNFDI